MTDDYDALFDHLQTHGGEEQNPNKYALRIDLYKNCPHTKAEINGRIRSLIRRKETVFGYEHDDHNKLAEMKVHREAFNTQDFSQDRLHYVTPDDLVNHLEKSDLEDTPQDGAMVNLRGTLDFTGVDKDSEEFEFKVHGKDETIDGVVNVSYDSFQRFLELVEYADNSVEVKIEGVWYMPVNQTAYFANIEGLEVVE